MRFRFLPNIATADLAFEAFGGSYNELFENAGLALESAQVDLTTIEALKIKKITLEAQSIEKLFLNFLEELIFLKDAERFLVGRIKCEVSRQSLAESRLGKSPSTSLRVNKKGWVLEAKISGETINSEKHKLGTDVKAVTRHLFKIEELPDKTLRCQVILDI